MKPTHVMVACPIECTRCNNTGKVDEHSFAYGNGCPDCLGERFTTRRITLREFADLFTWGTACDGNSQDQIIMPRTDRDGGATG